MSAQANPTSVMVSFATFKSMAEAKNTEKTERKAKEKAKICIKSFLLPTALIRSNMAVLLCHSRT